MNAGLMSGLLFGTLLILVFAGVPIAFAIGGTSLIFLILLWGYEGTYIIAQSYWGEMSSLVLIAIPLFVLMANFLEQSGVAEALYDMMHRWMGGLRGGLAVGTVFICTLFAAMSGLSATATVTMGLIALPAMLRRGYDKQMVMGAIMAGGGLGQLIPPSTLMIMYAMISQQSVGKMFMGGVIPGLILAAMYAIYILTRCLLNEKLGPPLPREERASWTSKFQSLKAVILPILLVISVLGGIYAGVCTPTEAAAVGAFGAMLSAGIHRKLNWTMFKQSCYRTMMVTVMIMWIIGASMCFSTVYSGLGASEFVKNSLLQLPGGRWGPIIAMQCILLLLGCFIDPTGILMVCTPIFVPIVKSLGFSPVWFGVLFVVNMEMAFLTPPVGSNLFYMKGVAPKDITMAQIYRSVVPYVAMQLMALLAVMLWPGLITWLPDKMVT